MNADEKRHLKGIATQWLETGAPEMTLAKLLRMERMDIDPPIRMAYEECIKVFLKVWLVDHHTDEANALTASRVYNFAKSIVQGRRFS